MSLSPVLTDKTTALAGLLWLRALKGVAKHRGDMRQKHKCQHANKKTTPAAQNLGKVLTPLLLVGFPPMRTIKA
jgi:hypothetical protein